MSFDWQLFLTDAFDNIAKVAQTSPGTVTGYKSLHAEGARTSHLTEKTRELICIAVAVTTRCDACIANHVKKAIKASATREEITEALGVAVAMNAGAALAFSGRALDAYETFAG
jgi:AhpD family alkylhydroperoxidase